MNVLIGPSLRRAFSYLCCGALMLTFASTAAAVGRDSSRPVLERGRSGDAAAPYGRPKPKVEGVMTTKLRFALRSALAVACRQVTEVESCGQLFSDLGADGLERLNLAVYFLRSDAQEVAICRPQGGAAFTTVGGTRIGLCDDFARQARSEAAVTLIHEALHHAGMTERPADPGALSSAEISQLVRERCEL